MHPGVAQLGSSMPCSVIMPPSTGRENTGLSNRLMAVDVSPTDQTIEAESNGKPERSNDTFISDPPVLTSKVNSTALSPLDGMAWTTNRLLSAARQA